jgi:hypothetical protein
MLPLTLRPPLRDYLNRALAPVLAGISSRFAPANETIAS